jgi:GNAT superfamily N-acetyltransferase
MLHVRPAEPSDSGVILGFIAEAADWLADKGTDQWSVPWPDEEQRDGRVDRGIADGCTWMVHDDGLTVGTISCRPEGNPRLWSGRSYEPAVYVSRLIVARSHAGQSIGNELFDWAGMWAAKQYGARWIRIDVWTTNTMLHNYYEKRGFSFLEFCEDVEYPSAALFQKATAEITAADVPRLHEPPDLKRPVPRLPKPDLAAAGSDAGPAEPASEEPAPLRRRGVFRLVEQLAAVTSFQAALVRLLAACHLATNPDRGSLGDRAGQG